ncbi:MAG: hypothetical protein HY719_12460 [Planctomycetes bacterium]|nr:hypothetical protein [Planctomycetota bacterium]
MARTWKTVALLLAVAALGVAGCGNCKKDPEMGGASACPDCKPGKMCPKCEAKAAAMK